MTDSDWAALVSNLRIKWDGALPDGKIPFNMPDTQNSWEQEWGITVEFIMYRNAAPLVLLLFQASTRVPEPRRVHTWMWMVFFLAEHAAEMLSHSGLHPQHGIPDATLINSSGDPNEGTSIVQAEECLVAYVADFYARWKAQYGDTPGELDPPLELKDIIDAHRILRP